MTTLADAIEARSRVLADRALEALYRNPFWDDRFGERGRRYAREDNVHHIAYLVQALRAASGDLLTNYARWLQQVLTTRGMCSRHIDENFERLAEASQAEGIADAAPAFAFLDEAAAALAYDGGPARAVQDAAARVVTRAAHASYLGDALANERPELFADYVRWLDGFLERQGSPTTYLLGTLVALDEALQTALGEQHGAVAAVLATGYAALEEQGR